MACCDVPFRHVLNHVDKGNGGTEKPRVLVFSSVDPMFSVLLSTSKFRT